MCLAGSAARGGAGAGERDPPPHLPRPRCRQALWQRLPVPPFLSHLLVDRALDGWGRHAVAGTGRTLYIGQILGSKAGSAVLEGSAQGQADAIADNLAAVLAHAGIGPQQGCAPPPSFFTLIEGAPGSSGEDGDLREEGGGRGARRRLPRRQSLPSPFPLPFP